MKIFFDFLHSHFRKLVGAALLTAMAGALYGLGTTLTTQTYAPYLKQQIASTGRPSYYPFASEEIKQKYLKSVAEIEAKDPTGGRSTGLSNVDACSYQWGVLTCSNESYTKAINDYYSNTGVARNEAEKLKGGGVAPPPVSSSNPPVSTVTGNVIGTAPAAAYQSMKDQGVNMSQQGLFEGMNPNRAYTALELKMAGDNGGFKPNGDPKDPVSPQSGPAAVAGSRRSGACSGAGCNNADKPGTVVVDVMIGDKKVQVKIETNITVDSSGRVITTYNVSCNSNCEGITPFQLAAAVTGGNSGNVEGYTCADGTGNNNCANNGGTVPLTCTGSGPTVSCVATVVQQLQSNGSGGFCGSVQTDLGSNASSGHNTGSDCGGGGGGGPPPTSPPSGGGSPTSAPAPTKAPCNATCTTSDQCAAGLSCINSICPSPAAGQAGCTTIDMRCRMPSNQSSATCDGYATPTVTPVPTATITPGGPTLTPTNTPTPPSSYIVSKYQSGVAKDGGSYVVSFAFTVRNTGSIDLSDITLVDTLPQKKPEFANPQVISLTTFPDGLLVLNGEYDGVTKTSILATGSKLRTGESAGVILAVRYTPSAKEYTCDGKYDFINKVDSQAAASTGAKLSQSSSVSFTIQQDACAPKIDLALTKEADKKTYVTGDEVTFTLKVTNQGKVNATNVAIRDYLKQIEPYFLLNWPSTVVKCVASVGQPNVAVPICIEGAGNIDFYIGDLAVGGSRTVTLKGKTLKGGSFTNITEIIPANEIDVDSAPSNCVADGQIVKKEDDCDSVVLSGVEPTPTPTIPGNPFTFVKKMVAAVPQTDGTTNISYLITAKNTKPISVTLSTVIDQIAQNDAGYSYTVIPASLMAVGATDQVNKSFNGKDNVNLLSLTQPLTLTAGGTDKSYVSVAYTIRVTPKSASVVRLCNEATLKGDIDGTQFTLVSATKDDNCTPIQQGALEIKKSASPQSVRLGESTVYTIELSNPSKATVADVSVEDILNSGIQYKEFLGIIATGGATSTSSTQVVSNDKTKILFGTYTLPGGSSVVLKFSATAAGECAKIYQNNVKAIRIVASSQTVLAEYTQTTAEDVIVQCASVASTPTPTPAPSTQYDVELSKTADKQTVKLGDIVTFTVTVHNQAVNTMLSLKVKDQLPASLQYMGHETSYGTYNNLDGIWTIGNLNPDQRQTLKLVTRVAGRDDLKNFAEVYAHEQKDIDSTPNNGRNGEDDNAQVELKLEDVFIAGPTKGGMLADTGYGVMVPLIAGMLFFLSLIALAEAHPNHKLVIRIVNPAHGASGLSFPKLRFMIMGTVVATGIAFAVSGLTFTQVVLQARVRLQQQYEYLQELRLVDATAATDKRNVELKCGVIIEPAYTFAEKSPVGFKITNMTDAPAVFAIPGIDVIQSVAGKSEVTIPSGTASLSFPSAGTWHIINPVYCPGSTALGVSKVTVEGAVVTPTPTTTVSGTPAPSTTVSQTPTPTSRPPTNAPPTPTTTTVRPTSTPAPTLTSTANDIQVVKKITSTNTSQVTPGSSVTYTVEVSLPSTSTLEAFATFVDTVPGVIGNVTWSCVVLSKGTAPRGSSDTSSCGLKSGTGSISSDIVLVPGGVLEFTLSGQLLASSVGPVTNTARVLNVEMIPIVSYACNCNPDQPSFCGACYKKGTSLGSDKNTSNNSSTVTVN